MKPYGVRVIPYPDVGDIHKTGAKSSVGNLRGPGGDVRGIHKNKSVKAATRRRWKRKARAVGKAEVKNETDCR